MTKGARQAREQAGRRAERLAAWWLRLKGWSILGERLRTRVGEVDLVARRGRILAFVEVKQRRDEAASALAIDEYRLARVARAAEALAPRFFRAGDTIRIDVIHVRPRRLPRHLADVWRG